MHRVATFLATLSHRRSNRDEHGHRFKFERRLDEFHQFRTAAIENSKF